MKCLDFGIALLRYYTSSNNFLSFCWFWPNIEIAKGGFFSESIIRLSNLQNKKNKYSKKTILSLKERAKIQTTNTTKIKMVKWNIFFWRIWRWKCSQYFLTISDLYFDPPLKKFHNQTNTKGHRILARKCITNFSNIPCCQKTFFLMYTLHNMYNTSFTAKWW